MTVKSIFVALVVIVAASCTSQPSHPDFTHTESEKSGLIADFKESDAEYLFLLLLDRSGNVVNLELLDWNGDPDLKRRAQVKYYVRNLKFNSSESTDLPYRELVFPLSLHFEAEFL